MQYDALRRERQPVSKHLRLLCHSAANINFDYFFRMVHKPNPIKKQKIYNNLTRGIFCKGLFTLRAN